MHGHNWATLIALRSSEALRAIGGAVAYKTRRAIDQEGSFCDAKVCSNSATMAFPSQSHSLKQGIKCSECGSKDISNDETGDLVCNDCGLVLQDLQLVAPVQRAPEPEPRSAGKTPSIATALGLRSNVGIAAAKYGLHDPRDQRRQQRWKKLKAQFQFLGASEAVIEHCKDAFLELQRSRRATQHKNTRGKPGSSDMKLAVEAQMLLDYTTEKAGLQSKAQPYTPKRSSTDLKSIQQRILKTNATSPPIDNAWIGQDKSHLLPAIVNLAKELNSITAARLQRNIPVIPAKRDSKRSANALFEAEIAFREVMLPQFERLFHRIVVSEAGYSPEVLDGSIVRRSFDMLWASDCCPTTPNQHKAHLAVQTEMLYGLAEGLRKEHGGRKFSRARVQSIVSDELKCDAPANPSQHHRNQIENILKEVIS